MPGSLPLRRWATPLTLGAAVLMSVTGITMFFDWEPGHTTLVHQWMSWIFLIGIGAHLAVNIRPLKLHLKSAWGRGSIVVFGVILALSFYHWGMISGPQMKDRIEALLVEAPVSALAGVARVSPEELAGRLAAHGFATGPGDSIHDLARRHGADENLLLAIVFLPERFAKPEH